MNRERAETHLRLLAEAELRRSTAPPANGTAGQRDVPSLALAAELLCTVGAVDVGAMDEIRHDLHFALAVRQPAPGGSSQAAQWRLERFMRFLRPPRTAVAFPVARPGAAWRVVPIGRVLRIRDDRARGELYLLAYAQTDGGARFTMTGWIEGSPGVRGAVPPSAGPPRRIRRQYIAVDDQGTRYQLGFVAGSGAGRIEWQGVLELDPGPPHQIRWLDVTTIPGEPATRIDLDSKDPQDPAPDITVTQRAVSPGELLLDVIAARLLTVAATYPQDTPEQLAAAKPGLVPHAAAGLGDIIAALRAADALSPSSPVPGQLAGLCARLGVSGHGITARPADDLPGPWLSMLTRYHRRTPQPAPASGRSVATAVELPELDGARFAILGLHHSDGATMFHLQASGVTPEDDWEYIRAVRPLPVLWIRDSSGRWHTTQTNGYYPTKTTGEVILPMAIVPPLAAGTPWVDMFAAGQSAEISARLPLHWT